MKATRSILMLLMAGGLAWADNPAPKAAPAPMAKPAAATAKAAAKPAAAPAKRKKTKRLPVIVAQPATAKPAPAEPQKTQPEEKASAAPELARRTFGAGKRDPFVSPIVSRTTGPVACATGKRCLQIDQIILRGIVKSPSGIIAVVENAARKAYFLRENDPVFNGYVVKITVDAVVFKETVTDRVGRASQREITKRVSPPAV
jgi:hypothetical protein